MNLVFDHYSDNPIIAVMVSWPPHPQGIRQIRVCCPLLRKPFMEVVFRNGESTQHVFGKQGFMRFWQEAELLIENLTDIVVIKEFAAEPMVDKEAFLLAMQTCLDDSIAESFAIFEGGMYKLFLDQYGSNCKGLPALVDVKIDQARAQVSQ